MSAELYSACVRDDVSAAQACLTRGANVNAKHNGFTHLITAVRYSKDIVKILLARDDLDITAGGCGDTALHVACVMGRAEAVALLIKDRRMSSKIINIKNDNGLTALMMAVKGNKYTCVEKMVGIDGVDWEIKNEDGESLEDVARRDDNMVLLKILSKVYTWCLIQTSNGLVLDIAGGQQGGKLIIFPKHGGNSQLWKLENGRLINKTGMVADIIESRKNVGTKVIGWEKHDGENQKWSIRDDCIHSKLTDMVMDMKDMKAGTEVIMYPKHGGANQTWFMNPAAPNPLSVTPKPPCIELAMGAPSVTPKPPCIGLAMGALSVTPKPPCTMAATLSQHTTEILQIIKPVLEENKKLVGETFYRKLFQQRPEVRGLFIESDSDSDSHSDSDSDPDEELKRQSLNLANALVDFTANCHQLEQLLPFVEQRVALGVVQPELYPVVGAILLETLNEVLGGKVVTKEVREAIAEGCQVFFDLVRQIKQRPRAKGRSKVMSPKTVLSGCQIM